MDGWRQTSVVELSVPQASGIASLGEGIFLVVDDDRGVYVAGVKGAADLAASREDHPELLDLEGICIGPDGQAWVLSERTSAVLRVPVERRGRDVTLGAPELMGEIEHIARKHNKGWEGIELLDGRFSPDGAPRLLASHEAKPKRIGVFSLPGLETEVLLRLPDEAKAALDDLSDLTVDPDSGNVLVLSDESAVIAELVIEVEDGAPSGLELVSITELDVRKKEKPEGLCFDENGVLWMVTDGDAHLRSFTRG